MDRLFFSLLTLLLQWFRPRYKAHLQLLQAQIRILRSRIDVSRIVPTPQEKADPLRLGALVGHDVCRAHARGSTGNVLSMGSTIQTRHRL
jgi:putative transposase